jgi:hypothetical protein
MAILEYVTVVRDGSRQRSESRREACERKSARALLRQRVDELPRERNPPLEKLARVLATGTRSLDASIDGEERHDRLRQVDTGSPQSVISVLGFHRRGVVCHRILNRHRSGWRHA